MTSNRRLGLIILILAPMILLLFIVGALYFGYVLFEFIVLVAVAAALGLFGWIGYTLFTEPAVPRANIGGLDRLAKEEIKPMGEESAGIKSRFSVIRECEIGEGTIVRDHVNLYRCRIGKDCKIESFVYMEAGVTIGDRCKVKPGANIPTGVTIEDDVFIGPYATFTNDKRPRVDVDWQLWSTIVCKGAS